MAHALNEFLQAATADNIRCTNQFEIEATSGYSDVDAVLEKTMIFGQNLAIPTRSINYATVSFKGYEMTSLVPTTLAMDQEHTMTVLEDINGENRRAFLAWQNHVMNAAISDGSLFEGDRGINANAILRIRLFDKDNKTVCQTYKFYNVCVKSVGSLELDYNGGDAGRFQVTFGSTYWELEDNVNGALKDIK